MALSRRTLFTVGGGLTATAALTASWDHKYGEEGVEETLKQWAADYPSATVDVTVVPADYEKALAAALLTPTAPDVFEYANGPTLDQLYAWWSTHS